MTDTHLQVLAIIGPNLIIMLTFFGISIALHNAIRQDVKSIQDEIKGFHGRLCKIEERNRGFSRRKNRR